MRRFLLKCKKEIVLFLTANTIWAGIGISLAFLLEYIADTVIQGRGNRITFIVLLVIVYLLLDTFFEFSAAECAGPADTEVQHRGKRENR